MTHMLDDASGDAKAIGHILRSVEMFQDWPADAMAQLCGLAHLTRCRRGNHLRPEDPLVREIVVIGSGFLALSATTHQGREFLLGIFGPGHILGILRLLPGGISVYDYTAREDAVVARLPSDPLLALLAERPALWAGVAKMALRQYRTAIDGIISRRLGSISERVAMLIDSLLTLHGIDDPEGMRFGVRISQEDLASMLSVTRQTINTELLRLEAVGIVRIDYKDLLIRDREALQARFERIH